MPPIPDPKLLATHISEREEVRKERLAISFVDFKQIDVSVRQRLLAGRLDLSRPVRVLESSGREGFKPSPALAFSCPLLSAATACDLLRCEDRRQKRKPCRVYLLRAKIWVKMGA